jgi:UDP-glucose:(heptosyl)LPS alpha-1,3-glucosyltransferase
MKKIALAMEKFSRYAGGAESYAVALASTLIEKGWDVHLYGEAWDNEPKEAVFHKIYIPKYLPAWFKLLLFAWKHKIMVRHEPYDVIMGFGNTIYMNVYQSHGGVHQFSTARKVYSEKNVFLRIIKRVFILLSIKYWTRAWIEAAPFRLKPRPIIIAIANMIKDDMELFFHTKPGEIEIIYNGVDTNRYNQTLRSRLRGNLRKQWGVNKNDTVFLFVSYDLKKKGIEPLVEAAANLKKSGGGDFKIVVVGGKPYHSLEKIIAKLDIKDKLVFTGRVKSTEEVYANSDVFVLPTYYDACSLVVIEAMASGLPAITTIYNGAAGIIDDGKNGYIIPHPPNSSELANKMRLLMDNSSKHKMSKNASVKGKKYSTQKNHKEVISLLGNAPNLRKIS